MELNLIKLLESKKDKYSEFFDSIVDITKDEREEAKKITNNNVFVGSTTDLQRMLLDKDKVIDAEAQE